MRRHIQATQEIWPLAQSFRIARGSKDEARVVLVCLTEGDHCGRGEACPYARYGESADSVLDQISSVAAELEVGQAGDVRDALQGLLPAGAARNAIDCALWDLEAKQSGRSVAALTALGEPGEIVSAQTIVIDSPEAMRASAARLVGAPLLKVKLDAENVLERLGAVREGAPDAKLIVDANESWTAGLLASLMEPLAALGVALLEQPLPVGEDAALRDVEHLVPLCADESCHTANDLGNLAGLYDFVNIKLDKTGGLTGALALANEARARGMGIMLGCMVSTSLAIAPAALLAGFAGFVDLDGAWWLAKDRENPVQYTNGKIMLPAGGLWGTAT